MTPSGPPSTAGTGTRIHSSGLWNAAVPGRHRGSVLVAVLWCVVFLAVVVVGMLHTSRMDLLAGHSQTDQIQARYLALAGIEKAKALLHQSVLERRRSGAAFSTELFDAAAQLRDISLGRGTFSVFRAPSGDESGPVVYGISDEESRLDVNVADTSELIKVVGMTPDIAAAIVDWRDGDNAVTPGGAEGDYYASLNPPYRPRNGPFPTVRELLMVRGVTPALLLGEVESSEPPAGSPPPVSGIRSVAEQVGKWEPAFEGGWSTLLTVHSQVENTDASGQARVKVQTADEAALTGIRGITSEIARAIVAYRQQNPLRNLTDLLDVTAPQPGGGPDRQGGNGNGGPKVIDERLFKEIADHVTMEDSTELTGPVNLNTASAEVLLCLPGMTRALAQAVVAHRRANGYFQSPAHLLDVAGFNRSLIQQIAPRVTVRSDTYRIRAEGAVGRSRQALEIVVRVRARTVTTLAYREDDL
jgi:DNA uptake protein ComE-like DNA-binding protein